MNKDVRHADIGTLVRIIVLQQHNPISCSSLRHKLWKPIIRSVFMTVCSNWASEWSVKKTDSLLQQFRFWLVWHVLSGQPALRHSCPDNYLHVSLLELMSYWIAEHNSLLDTIKYFYKVRNDLWNIYIYIFTYESFPQPFSFHSQS